jgi:hypothetical protein
VTSCGEGLYPGSERDLRVRVRGIVWIGAKAGDDYLGMLHFLRDVLGLSAEFEEEGTAELSLANDDRVQIFGADHPHSEFLDAEQTTLVPLFEVDDIEGACSELRAANVELVGDLESDSKWAWQHFRAPDGNLYSLGSRRSAGQEAP